MHLPNSVYKYSNLQTYLCKALVSSNAAGFPVYYKSYSGPQLMILRVLVAFIRTTRMDTSCFGLPHIIILNLPIPPLYPECSDSGL